jgi:hypothetical protein
MATNIDRTAVFIELLRMLVEQQITPDAASQAYPLVLARLGLPAGGSLAADLASWRSTESSSSTDEHCSCSGSETSKCACTNECSGSGDDDEPDFASMPASEKVARTLAKWDRILG